MNVGYFGGPVNFGILVLRRVCENLESRGTKKPGTCVNLLISVRKCYIEKRNIRKGFQFWQTTEKKVCVLSKTSCVRPFWKMSQCFQMFEIVFITCGRLYVSLFLIESLSTTDNLRTLLIKMESGRSDAYICEGEIIDHVM